MYRTAATRLVHTAVHRNTKYWQRNRSPKKTLQYTDTQTMHASLFLAYQQKKNRKLSFVRKDLCNLNWHTSSQVFSSMCCVRADRGTALHKYWVFLCTCGVKQHTSFASDEHYFCDYMYVPNVYYKSRKASRNTTKLAKIVFTENSMRPISRSAFSIGRGFVAKCSVYLLVYCSVLRSQVNKFFFIKF